MADFGLTGLVVATKSSRRGIMGANGCQRALSRVFAAHHGVIDSLGRETIDEPGGVACQQNAMRGDSPKWPRKGQRIEVKVTTLGMARNHTARLQVLEKAEVLFIRFSRDLFLDVFEKIADTKVHV